MDLDISGMADRSAKSLDEGSHSRFANEFARSKFLGKQREFVKEVDKLEVDGVGEDLVVKYDENKIPTAFQIIPSKYHDDAKQMAELMDSSKVEEAKELRSKVFADIDTDNPGVLNHLLRNVLKNRWGMVVDFYEKPIGDNVDIKYYPGGASYPNYSFDPQFKK